MAYAIHDLWSLIPRLNSFFQPYILPFPSQNHSGFPPSSFASRKIACNYRQFLHPAIQIILLAKGAAQTTFRICRAVSAFNISEVQNSPIGHCSGLGCVVGQWELRKCPCPSACTPSSCTISTSWRQASKSTTRTGKKAGKPLFHGVV